MTDGSGAPVAGPSGGVGTAHPQQLLAELAARMSDGLIIVGPDHRVRFASERALEILGGSPSWTGKMLSELGADYRLVLTVSSCFDHARPVTRSLAGTRGETETVIWALPLGAPGVADEVAVVVRDDSEVRRLEAVRRDFIANVSHELRTPASAIKLMVETLQGGALVDSEASSGFVDRIGQEADHMAHMIEELLELSAAESERRVANPMRVALADVLATLERLRPLAEDREVTIQVGSTAGTPEVLGDPARLGQVIRNLVHNSIKFSPPKTVVTVTVAGVAAGERVEMAVADRGRGITPDDLPRVFERFWKGDASRQRDGEGSGLGLAIARHIIEAHGGTITVASEPDQGTVFTVSLPALPTPS